MEAVLAVQKRSSYVKGLLILAVIGLIGVYGFFALTDPWIFTVGRLRPYPLWEGKAEAKGPGGDYAIYIGFYPSTGPQVRAATWVDGFGFVCAPGGQSYYAHVGGSTDSVVWKNMNNLPFHIYTRGPTSLAHMLARAGLPPELEFRGRWQGDQLEMADDGTITAAFLSDGSLNPNAPIRKPDAEQKLVFHEGLWGLWNPCP